MPHDELAGFLSRQYTPAPVRNPFMDSELEDFEPSEEALIQEQLRQGQMGAASGGAYALPSRESLRESAFSNLRSLLERQSREAEARALPARVTGEYGLEEARIKGRSDIEAAKLAADRYSMLEEGRDRRSQANLDAMMRRLETAEAGKGQRAAGAEQGRQQRQQTADLLRRAGAVEKQPEGMFSQLGRLFGITSGPSPQEQAEQLRQQAIGSLEGGEGGDDISAAAAELQQAYPGRSVDELVAAGIVEGSPEEIDALRRVMGQ